MRVFSLVVVSFCAVVASGCSFGVGNPKTAEVIAQQYGFTMDSEKREKATGQCKRKQDWPDPQAKLSIADWLTCYQIPDVQEGDTDEKDTSKELRLLRAQSITVAWAQYAAFVIRAGDENAKSDALAVIGHINESQKRIAEALGGKGPYRYLPTVERVNYMNGAYNVMLAALRPTARNSKSAFSNVASAIANTPRRVIDGSISVDSFTNFLLNNRTVNAYLAAFRVDMFDKFTTVSKNGGKTNNEQDWGPLNTLLDDACKTLAETSEETAMTCTSTRPTVRAVVN